MPSAGFEDAIPEIERLQNYSVYRTTSGIGSDKYRLALLLFRFILVKNEELHTLYSSPSLTQIYRLFCLATNDLRYIQASVFILQS